MGWILLTNDDGVDSPALRPFATALAALGPVRVVAPARERSWVGKAITRHGTVSVEPLDAIDGVEGWSHDGYPADGVQLGVHTLTPSRPELVVAGVNLGYNHGQAFLMSSGTVGAAIEAWAAGVPAIAFSTARLGDYESWRRTAAEPRVAASWERLAAVCVDITRSVVDSGVLEVADVVTVNLPFDADGTTPRRVTDVARVGYERLFRSDDGGYRFAYTGEFRGDEPGPGTDVHAASRGWVSITPLRLPHAAAIEPAVRGRLERTA